MDIFTATQTFILLVFLGVMIVALIFIRHYQPQLRQKFTGNKILQILEVTPLSTKERAVIVSARGAEFLILTSSKHGASITPLPPQQNQSEDKA